MSFFNKNKYERHIACFPSRRRVVGITSRTQLAVLLLIACLICSRSARTQAAGTLQGSVQDTSGALVPNAHVTATNAETRQSHTVLTDSSGNVAIPLLPIGTYLVRIETARFARFVQNGVVLQANTAVSVHGKGEVVRYVHY